MLLARVLPIVAILLCAAVARADVESPEVLAGVAAYNGLEYEKAITLLKQALGSTLTREEKLVTYKTLAFSYFATGNRPQTIAAFQNVLRLDENFELDRSSAPAERAALEEARAQVATGLGGQSGGKHALSALKPTITPPHPIAGQTVRMRVDYPGGLAERMSLFYRPRGVGLYSRSIVGGDVGGRFDLTMPGARVVYPGMEYYIVALDEGGASVARAGSLSFPLAFDVRDSKKPVYKRGWFWGMMTGIVVAGAGVATALVLVHNSTLPTSVTVSPY
jgi:tetratricopeptide (TPR) repeat protein